MKAPEPERILRCHPLDEPLQAFCANPVGSAQAMNEQKREVLIDAQDSRDAKNAMGPAGGSCTRDRYASLPTKPWCRSAHPKASSVVGGKLCSAVTWSFSLLWSISGDSSSFSGYHQAPTDGWANASDRWSGSIRMGRGLIPGDGRMLQTAQRPPVFDPDGVGLCLMSTAPPGQRFHGSSLDNMTGVSYPVLREHDMGVMLCVRFQC